MHKFINKEQFFDYNGTYVMIFDELLLLLIPLLVDILVELTKVEDVEGLQMFPLIVYPVGHELTLVWK